MGELVIKDYGQQVDSDAAKARADLEARYGQVWSSEEVRQAFDIVGFSAPFVVAVRKSDGKRGALEFTHHPRFYYDFQEG